jgi:NADPH:quinone reductase-like Zn-dependent oxidoreductase
MKAAVITSFDLPPRYEDFAEPVPRSPSEMQVEVLAAALHHLTVGKASGKHYSSSAEPPFIPGVDGVGRGADGLLRYFLLLDTRYGSLAERTVIEQARSFVLPDGSDPVIIAGAINPGLAAWVALRRRARFERGQNVLILGATGATGTMAVQVARHLGASQIIACGRNEERLARLPALGATDIVTLGDPHLGEKAREVDVVLDLVWGDLSAELMGRIVRSRADRTRTLTWVEIGSMAGASAAIPGEILRGSRLQIIGSGFGSVTGQEMLQELPSLVTELVNGTLRLDVVTAPLRDIERAWREAARSSERIVITPARD